MPARIQTVLLSELDRRAPTLKNAQTAAHSPAGGWLRAVRQALGLAQADVAKITSVSKQAYAQLERGETAGTLSLSKLQRAAEAMDCELVYFLVPRAQSFGALATRLDPDFAHLQASEHSMALEGQAVGDLPKAARAVSSKASASNAKQ